ncbi:hypothetical protein [Streptomyces tsukubensis]|uniref:HTH iclR-type domain-containing protein n=1 Tax=Streptomyces tsukubensis TaxID=83656 RepID=A0A1V4AET8_9ACTN|nr:hypothetical protein [Streptomyces tsukubensis]OON82614.1 hypothetical protein B1H18_00630 [Streptomyces tsukubensis]QFR92219.1 hypothetical protein GBW32_03060 [Streptomyces tsukubensis]
MAKRRQQKGRRHRTVNRTPRPVGAPSGRTAKASRQETVPAVTGGRTSVVREERTVPEPAAVSAAVPEARATAVPEARTRKAATAPGAAASTASGAPTAPVRAATGAPAPKDSGEPVDAGLFAPASSGGLGRTAAKTWDQLRASGAEGVTLDDLAARVGYQPSTVAKHVQGLAARDLVQQRADRWYPAQAGPALS